MIETVKAAKKILGRNVPVKVVKVKKAEKGRKHRVRMSPVYDLKMRTSVRKLLS